MAKKQNKPSVVAPKGLPKTGMALGAHGSGGVLDPTTLPKPTLPEWGGWKSIDR